MATAAVSSTTGDRRRRLAWRAGASRSDTSRSDVARRAGNMAKLAETAWIWSVVGYSVLRFVVAWGAFADHGANVWIFGLIDVGTAWPYAKAVAVVCRRAADSQWRSLPAPLAMALATFFAPYAYLWFAAGSMPSDVRVGMVICVTVLLVAASAGVLSKTRRIRREAGAVASAAPVADAADDVIGLASLDETSTGEIVEFYEGEPVEAELLIDLTGAEAEIRRLAVNR